MTHDDELQVLVRQALEDIARSELMTQILIVLNLLNLMLFPIVCIWLARHFWVYVEGAVLP